MFLEIFIIIWLKERDRTENEVTDFVKMKQAKHTSLIRLVQFLEPNKRAT